MTKTITDKWPIRHMRLDDEVFDAVMRLKEKYGSPNKGLRAVLLNDGLRLQHESNIIDELNLVPIGIAHEEYERGRVEGRKAFQREMRSKGDKTR